MGFRRLSLPFFKRTESAKKLQKNKPIDEEYSHPPSSIKTDHALPAVSVRSKSVGDILDKSLVAEDQDRLAELSALDHLRDDGFITHEDLEREARRDAALMPKKVIKQYPPLLPDLPTDSHVVDHDSRGLCLINRLEADLWCHIANMATLSGAASLAFSCKTLRYKLGARPWDDLNAPENKLEKINFLLAFDDHYQHHLLCFLCAIYHPRKEPGKEKLIAQHVSRPVFDCPNARHLPLPRMRLTHGRELPFAFVQLVMRAYRHSPDHGLGVNDLARRWDCKDSDWSHRTRFMVYEGHLLMRTTSTTYARKRLQPSEQRLLLYSRSDYAPYFSVCEHWHNGDLLKLCKCALSHVPEEGRGVWSQLRDRPRITMEKTKTNYFPKLCDECKPLRRCPECPSEYLLELRFMEDKKDRITPFKHALVVSRWSDLGDGRSPSSPEWASCVGKADYDSFAKVSNSTLCSTFENAMSNGAPGQRALSLAPKGRPTYRLREDVY